jgi:pyridoxal phosphate enzyme (YggS family)
MSDPASQPTLAVSDAPDQMDDQIGDEIGERLAGIRAQIGAACARAGRAGGEVTLVAVSKTVPVLRLRAGIAAGLRIFGENRVQEASDKITALAAETARHGIEWHLIGHLQSNKARRASELFQTIDTVDSVKLAERLDQIAQEMGRKLPILIEVNLGGESSKSGFAPAELFPAIERLSKLSSLDPQGLMMVPPYLEPAEGARPFFRRLRELRDEARKSGIIGAGFATLSMGMSHDFAVAIEEGATMVRIGTALFGPRT